MSDLGFKEFAKEIIEKVNGGASESDIIDTLSVGYSIIKANDPALNLSDVNASDYDGIRHRLIGKACSLKVGEHNTRYEVATVLVDTMISEGII